MFNRRKKESGMSEGDFQPAAIESAHNQQEWEEYIPSEGQMTTNGGVEEITSKLVRDEERLSVGEPKPVCIEDDLLDIKSFPALRIAYGLDDPESGQEPVFSHVEELDEEEIRQRLIQKYAEEADEQMSAQMEMPAEDLPALFRIEPKAEAEEGILLQEEPEEFTMESEIAKQQEISGELFEYIGAIESDANALIRQREQDRAKERRTKAYDPYNAQFNSRYDDTDKVLEETPEIPIKPKYQMED